MKDKFPKTKSTLDKIFYKEEKTPYELIVCKCFDCCAYNPLTCKSLTSVDFNEAVDSIKHCDNYSSCVLAGYATGKRMFTKKQRVKRELTEEQRQILVERMNKARLARQNNKSMN